MSKRLPADAIRKGETVRTTSYEPVTVVRAEYLNHPTFVGADGETVPARRERWIHVRFADGGRLLTHPTHLMREV